MSKGEHDHISSGRIVKLDIPAYFKFFLLWVVRRRRVFGPRIVHKSVKGKVWILSMSVSEEEVEEGQAEDKDARVARAPA